MQETLSISEYHSVKMSERRQPAGKDTLNINNSRRVILNHFDWSDALDEEIAELYTEGISVEQIAKKIGAPYGSTSARLSWIGIAGTRRPILAKFVFTEYTKELAYLVGAYITDGWSTYRQVGIGVNDQDFAENFAKCASVILGRVYAAKKFQSPKSKLGFMWKSVVGSSDLAEWLVKETESKSTIPDGIRNATEEIQLSFLAGAMDGDGIMSRYERRAKNGNVTHLYDVGFCGTQDFVHQIPVMMNKIGIVSGKKIIQDRGSNRTMFLYHFNPKSVAFSKFNFGIERKNKRLLLLREKYLPQRLYAETE